MKGSRPPHARGNGLGTDSWLARLPHDDAAGARTAADPLRSGAHEEEACGLNFRTAIQAHHEWKSQLQAAIEGRSGEDLDPELVARDDQCELGRWIHAAGSRAFASQPHFVDLREKHGGFHVRAALVLSLARSGQQALAAAELAPGGEFARISREVVGALASTFMRLKEDKL